MNDQQTEQPILNGGGKLEDAFWRFHKNNPHVYPMLVARARQYRAKGHIQLGIARLFEDMRREENFETRGDIFRLCNNHRAFYARLIMRQEPDLDGLFILRVKGSKHVA